MESTNGGVTFEEYLRRVPEGDKADLIHGVIYRAALDTFRENRMKVFLASLLEGFLGAKELAGEIFLSRFTFRLSNDCAIEPDVAYVSPMRTHLIHERFVDGGPDIAVEIVSDDSRTRDQNDKRGLYRDAGVTEYWMIDAARRHVELLRLSDGAYVDASLENDRVFRSSALPGFWLNVDWLIGEKLPNTMDCLREILRDTEQRPS
jgi:Uma2 family endonuclease